MKTNKEIVEHLNSLKIKQTQEWNDDISKDLYEKYFKDSKAITFDLDVDKHRWYETSMEVLEINNGYIGIRSVTDVVGESNCIEDQFYTLKFYEMETIQITSYKIKE